MAGISTPALGNVTISGADGSIQDGVSSSIKATVLDYTNSNPLAVRLTDTSGDYVSAGAGTQYTEDAAAAANPTGNAQILVRTDTPATQVTTDGDNVAQRGTNYGAAYVQLVTSAGAYIDSVGGGTEYTEDVATANPIVGKAIMVERDDALTTVTPIEGDNIGLRGTAEGALWTQDFNSDAILADTTATKNALETVGGLVVNLGANNDVTVTGTVTANLSATDNAVLDAIEADTTTIAGAVSGTEMQVDIVSLPAVDTELTTGDLDTGAGTDTRAVIGLVGSKSGGGEIIPGSATDGLLVNLGANNDVTLTSTTITGTVAVTQSGTWDEVGINDSGNAITVDWAGTAPPIGAGVEATALRVTLATDSTGVVSVDDNGGILTVDGTVTANLSATDNAVLDAIEVDTTTIAGAVSGTEMQVDVLTMPTVTVDLGVNNDVTVTSGAITETNSGAIKTAVEIIDNAIAGTEMQVDVVAALPAGTNAIGKLAANSGVDIGDVDILSIAAGSTLIGDVGISGARTSGGSTPYKNIDVDESEDQVKATAGQVYWIHAMNTGATPNYLKFYNATAATVVVGTTVPDLTFLVPANADSDGAGFNFAVPNGIAFGTAITIAATLNAADADATAPTGTIIVNLGYA